MFKFDWFIVVFIIFWIVWLFHGNCKWIGTFPAFFFELTMGNCRFTAAVKVVSVMTEFSVRFSLLTSLFTIEYQSSRLIGSRVKRISRLFGSKLNPVKFYFPHKTSNKSIRLFGSPALTGKIKSISSDPIKRRCRFPSLLS